MAAHFCNSYTGNIRLCQHYNNNSTNNNINSNNSKNNTERDNMEKEATWVTSRLNAAVSVPVSDHREWTQMGKAEESQSYENELNPSNSQDQSAGQNILSWNFRIIYFKLNNRITTWDNWWELRDALCSRVPSYLCYRLALIFLTRLLLGLLSSSKPALLSWLILQGYPKYLHFPRTYVFPYCSR